MTEPRDRVVVVDPTGDLGDLLGEALRAGGFAVDAVRSASDCLVRVERDEVDGVLSRYDLPDYDGLHLLRSVRVTRPTLPFLLAPRDGSEHLAADAIAVGVTGYVTRDSDPRETAAYLRDALRGARDATGNERSHLYGYLLDISPTPINLFDESGRTIWGNDAVLDLLGLTRREELVGRSIFEFIHPDDHDRARAEVASVIDEKEPTGPTEMRLRRADGAVRHIRVSTAIGTYLGVDVGQAVVVDVTARKERERQLAVLDTWLRHNIRNKLNLITGFAEDARSGRGDDVAALATRIQQVAETLVRQADRERELIDLLLNPPTPRPTDVTGVVERVVRERRKRHPAAEIEIVRADALEATAIPEFADAVGELIDNAVVHNDADRPHVEVTVEARSGDGGRVRIADDGPGVPRSELEFLPLDREIDQLNHGSGLGLVFVCWVMRLSDGAFAVETGDAGGSVATLSLQRTAD